MALRSTQCSNSATPNCNRIIQITLSMFVFHKFSCNPPEVEADNTTKSNTPTKKHQARGFAIMFGHYGCSGLHSNGSFWTTEEALSLIKEEEVLISCEYVVPPNRTSQKCSSEQEGKQANSLTFNPHMTSKGRGDLSKV